MEPNAVPGFTHRTLARFVARALVSFPETASWFPQGRAEVTGLPVREEFFALPPNRRRRTVDDSDHRRQPGFADAQSRGGAELAAVDAGHPVRLIHQTGARGVRGPGGAFSTPPVSREKFSPFFDDMPRRVRGRDLIVSRAGMGAVSEIAAAGKPSILVPLPTASDQHQLRNAEALERPARLCWCRTRN